jgi:hypothetical protein
MLSPGNKWLLLKNAVKLTEHIDPVIYALDDYFMEANVVAYVTSGLRGPDDQFRIIRNEIQRRSIQGYSELFDGDVLNKKVDYDGQEIYAWQLAWSKLLSLGFVVNPPYPAVVLMDYFRPGSNENRKGKLIGDSPHTRGTAFDISGGMNGVTDEAQCVERAMGKIKGLKGYLIERNNNAIHVDCHPVIK